MIILYSIIPNIFCRYLLTVQPVSFKSNIFVCLIYLFFSPFYQNQHYIKLVIELAYKMKEEKGNEKDGNKEKGERVMLGSFTEMERPDLMDSSISTAAIFTCLSLWFLTVFAGRLRHQGLSR